MHVISFTTGFAAERHLATRWRPIALRFLTPMRAEVRATDPLPVHLPCGAGELLVKRFTETGFLVEEIDTIGDQVQAEVYLDESGGPDSVPSYKVRVVNELIERGIAIQHSIHPQFPAVAAEAAEGWVGECWERLGEAVEGLRGLFHIQTYAGSTPAEISGYIDQRLAELRDILRRLT